MLELITLKIIYEIFEEAEKNGKIGAYSKMLYINCLTENFKNKEALIINAYEFSIKSNIFNKYTTQLNELMNTGLVRQDGEEVIFPALWGKKIDRSKLKTVNAVAIPGLFQPGSPNFFKKELLESVRLKELLAMKYKIGPEKQPEMIDLFIAEQETFEKTYQSFQECLKHCYYWMESYNQNKFKKEEVQKVVSKSRLLGE